MHPTPLTLATYNDRWPRPRSSGWLRRLAFWFDRACQRETLAELTDHQLRDIGLTRSQADAEAAKPFWR